ncbi:MFS transporter [Streptomyces sp. H39-S7]|uniref:MFS transporter n=1 Tax=Streptomyces sp. H39-S7 TaxID=3004357 RepID=UPI0022AFE741|nr:MFS transporter [Streptomyces sp. H39-S7]MCZ4121981.1 MFS transporter [Streptomyces sp. H39-S7]
MGFRANTTEPGPAPVAAPLPAPDRGISPGRSPLVNRLAVLSVTMGIFSIVTTEILPIGLLTPIGSGFRVSEGVAGLMMTMPGIVAAIAAPVVTVTTGRLDRRLMLSVLMGLLAFADFLAAAAPAFWVMLLSRVLVGITIGGFWSIGAGLAPRLVPPGSASRATAVIFSAVPLGSVLGVPAGALIGELAGWRASFLVMGVLSVGVLIALRTLLPPLPAVQVTRLSALRGMLRERNVRVGLLATFLVVIAHFAAYTYVEPFLQQVTQVKVSLISTFLLVYGAAGVIGNFVAGWAITRGLRATWIGCTSLLAAATLLLPVLGGGRLTALGLLVVWGLAYGAVPVCSSTWFARSAPNAPEAATVLFTASFQATLSAGALVGGVIVDRTSTATVMTLSGSVAVLMVAMLWGTGGMVRPAR